ncbi:MAG: hypothetical protein GX829_07045 [Clostridium sp.]|nr:hypothetical protein [Clostridium sp.]
MNIFLLLIIFYLGRSDLQNAVYEFPALIAVIIGWVAIIKSRKKLHKEEEVKKQ